MRQEVVALSSSVEGAHTATPEPKDPKLQKAKPDPSGPNTPYIIKEYIRALNYGGLLL